MTKRERFADWWERRGPEAVHMTWTEDACWFAWQASRLAALEEAAERIEPRNASEDWTEYASIRAEAAASIRALATETNNG
jgi:hypothetical protein